MDHDDAPDEELPSAAEQVLARWRALNEPGEPELRSYDQVMGILRSSSVRDSHETLVDTALLAAPLPRQPGEGGLPEPYGVSLSLQALALEQLLGRQRIASAVSGLTVALFLALVLWMASTNQVGGGPLVRGPQGLRGASLRETSGAEPLTGARSRTSSVREAAGESARESSNR
jgi:hypothetical protein